MIILLISSSALKFRFKWLLKVSWTNPQMSQNQYQHDRNIVRLHVLREAILMDQFLQASTLKTIHKKKKKKQKK